MADPFEEATHSPGAARLYQTFHDLLMTGWNRKTEITSVTAETVKQGKELQSIE